MPGPRNQVSPPTFLDRQYGLLSVVQTRYDEPDVHWRNGVWWQDLCGNSGTTFDDYCVTGSAPAKASNNTVNNFAAYPFTVFGEVDCSPVGATQQEQRARAVDILTRTESYQVERAFWSGTVGGSAGLVYPHLAADTATTETQGGSVITLQCAATVVTGVALDITEGLGRLEAAFTACGNGQGVLHVPAVLGPALFDHYLAKTDGAQVKTYTGHLVSIGAGYLGTSPAGVTTAGVAWVYMTGPVFAYRSAPETFTFSQMLDRDNNTLKSIVERTYVLGYNCCCVYAVPIAVGGDITGTFNSAT